MNKTALSQCHAVQRASESLRKKWKQPSLSLGHMATSLKERKVYLELSGFYFIMFLLIRRDDSS